MRANPKTTNHMVANKPPSPKSAFKEAKVPPYKSHQLKPIVYTTAPIPPDDKDVLELGGNIYTTDPTPPDNIGKDVLELIGNIYTTDPSDEIDKDVLELGDNILGDQKTEKLVLGGSDDMGEKVEEQTANDVLDGQALAVQSMDGQPLELMDGQLIELTDGQSIELLLLEEEELDLAIVILELLKISDAEMNPIESDEEKDEKGRPTELMTAKKEILKEGPLTQLIKSTGEMAVFKSTKSQSEEEEAIKGGIEETFPNVNNSTARLETSNGEEVMKSNERDEVKPMSVPFFPFSRVAEDQDEMTKVTSDGVNEKEEELARTAINVHRIGCNGTSSTERTVQQQHPMSLPCAREKLRDSAFPRSEAE